MYVFYTRQVFLKTIMDIKSIYTILGIKIKFNSIESRRINRCCVIVYKLWRILKPKISIAIPSFFNKRWNKKEI